MSLFNPDKVEALRKYLEAELAMAALVRGQFQHLLAPIITGHFQVIDYYGRKWEVHSIDNPIYRDPGRDGILLPGWEPDDFELRYWSADWDKFDALDLVKQHEPEPITKDSLIGEALDIETLYSWKLCMDADWRQNAVRREKCGAHWRHRGVICTQPKGHTGTHQGKYERRTLMWTDEDMVHVRKKSTTTLIGWRVWKCVKGPRLKSVTADREWDSPVMRTKPGTVPSSWLEETTIYDNFGGHQLPHPANMETHDYGVYAYKTPLLCWEKLLWHDRNRFHDTPQYLVIGSMDLSGIVVEHELGYRAEIAAVRELWYISNDFSDALGEGQRRARELGEFYKCDCHVITPGQVKGWAKWYTDGDK